jgi:hypothetical protein
MKLLYFIVLISAIAVAAAREEGEFHFVSSVHLRLFIVMLDFYVLHTIVISL